MPYLTENSGNNAFSFEKRKNPRLFVSPAIDGTLENVKPGTEIVFEDFDEHGVLRPCTGLQNPVRFRLATLKAPLVVVDNHNRVFHFWYEALSRGQIGRGGTLVHIDAHKDTRVPKRNMTAEEARDLEAIEHYATTVLNVGNYIPPALAEGLFSELISITSEKQLLESPVKKTGPLTVNIDLDFWAPELDYIPRAISVPAVQEWMREADLITFATSPFFIEQERAIAVLGQLCDFS